MTHVRSDEQACQKFRAKLDSYIDNELLTEGNLEMIEHFRRCTSCTQEAQDRRNLRRRDPGLPRLDSRTINLTPSLLATMVQYMSRGLSVWAIGAMVRRAIRRRRR